MVTTGYTIVTILPLSAPSMLKRGDKGKDAITSLHSGRFEWFKGFHWRHSCIRRQCDSLFDSNRPPWWEVTAFTPFLPPLSCGSQETPNRKMLYLVVIIIKMSHDTFHSSANYHYSDREVLYRSKIGDNVDEISHTCHFGLDTSRCSRPWKWWFGCCGARSRSISMI